MRTLIAPTENFVKTASSILDADVAAGSNVVLTLQNNHGFANQYFVCVGWEGNETAELVQVNAAVTEGTSITVDALTKAHRKGEPVTVFRFNKRKFYGSTTASGSYTELTSLGSPKTISVDNPSGTSLEYTGSTYSYFKATYYNSQDTTETDLADSEAVQGDQTARYCSIYAIKRQAGLTNNPYITDDVIETYRKRAESEVNSYIVSNYQLPLVNANGDTEVPAIIENATVLLAAGYMDFQEFGKEGEGVKWLGEARSLLKKIQDGSMQLIGEDGQLFSQYETTGGVASWPNAVDGDNGQSQSFTMGQRF